MGDIEWAWYVPVEGDGRHVGTYEPETFPSIANLTRVIQAAERAGFATVLIPTQLLFNNQFAENAPIMDTWTVGSALAMVTSSIRLLVATKIGLSDPVLLAKQGATLDHISGGRFCFNITTGSTSRIGSEPPLDHDSRYARTREAIQLIRLLWTQDRTTFRGNFYSIEDAVSSPKPVQTPHPPFYMAGLSDAAKAISAEEADVHLIQGEAPEKVKTHIDDLAARAQRVGRSLRFGVRLQVIVRDTEEQAWQAARELLACVDERVVARRSTERGSSESVQARQMNSYGWADHIVGPNLWGGMRTVRAGAGNALVGTPEQLAERCVDYLRVGVTTFILSGYPQDEEALRVGRDLIPLVEDRTSRAPYRQSRAL